MNGRKSQGHRKDSEQGSGRIPLQCSCSQSWIPLFYALCGHSEMAKQEYTARTTKGECLTYTLICPLSERGKPNLYLYCVRQGKTKGLAVLLFPLGFWRTCSSCTVTHSLFLPWMCQTGFLLSAVVLTLLGPVLLTLLIIGQDWCWADKEEIDGGPPKPPEVHV